MKWFEALRRRPAALFGLVLVLVVGGSYRVWSLPSSIFPSVTFPIVKVIIDAGEEPAARMMPTVTRPVEEAIRRVPGVMLVRSITSRGSSELSAQFQWGTDMQVALERVQGETQRIRPDLPPDTKIDVEWMNPVVFPIQGYALTSDTLTQAELWDLAEYSIKPALLGINGVSEIQVQGGRRREFQIRLDRAALEGRGLSAADVADVVRAQNDVLSAGLIERNHELYLALVTGRVHDLEALSRITVPVPGAPPATLDQLGTLTVANEVSYVRTTANGKPAVLVNVIQQPSANTLDIAAGVDQLFRDRPNLLPAGVSWTTFYDQARFVSNSVTGTEDAILIGVLLAGLVLLAFLRRWRTTLVAAAAIPVTVAIVGLALGSFGQTVNLMTLAGVAAALGLIADDSIVVVEDIERRRDEGERDPAGSSIRQLLPALIGSSLSTVIIFLPFSTLPGITGAFFKPLALTMAMALAISFFVAVLAAPTALVWLEGIGKGGGEPSSTVGEGAGKKPGPEDPGPAGSPARSQDEEEAGIWRRGVERFWSFYEAVVGVFVDHGLLSLAAVVALVAAGWLLYRGIGTDFLPGMDEGSIILDYRTPSGTSLSDTDRMLDHVEDVIMSLPDVESYSRRTGTELGFFVTEPNTGDYVINLKPLNQRRPVDEVIDDLRSRIARVEPAVETDFGQLLEDDIGDLTGGEPQPIDVKIFGDDPDLLARKARQVAGILEGVQGVEDVFDGIVIAGPALDVRVRPEDAARYGLTTQQVHDQVEPVTIGTVVDQLRVGDRMYDVRVMEPDSSSLEDLRIRADSALIPLGAVADISTSAPEAEIDRENLKTYIGVTARLSGRDLGGTVAEIQRKVADQVQLAPGMDIRYGGQYEQQQQSFQDLLYVLLAGLLLVSLVVLFAFDDWRASVITSVCGIAVLAGSLAALHVTGKTLNISSYVGAIMMVGIVGEKAMFAINEGKLALEEGLSPKQAWLRASRRRLRPVLMTIFATGFALLPLALALGQGAQLMQPLAIAVIGGFSLSGPIVLLLLPGLYRLLDPKGKLGARTGGS